MSFTTINPTITQRPVHEIFTFWLKMSKIVKNYCPYLGFKPALGSRFVAFVVMAIEFFNRAAVKGGGAKGYCRV